MRTRNLGHELQPVHDGAETINSQTSLSFPPLISWTPLGEPKWNPGGMGILEKNAVHTRQGEKDGE